MKYSFRPLAGISCFQVVLILILGILVFVP